MHICAFLSLLFIATVLLPITSRAQDVDWEAAIERVERSSSEYSDYAFRELGSMDVGTANDSIKYNTHICAILGRMLGMPKEIKHIETFDYPSMNSSSDAFDLMVFAVTLRNWVAAARDALAWDHDERANVWNLECAGEMGIAKNLYVKSGNPQAKFKVENQTLFVYGDIDKGFFAKMKTQLEANPDLKQVALGSGGGSVQDAILAGYEIRRLKLSTALYGNCFSACPLIFMAGTERVMWATGYRLGFHQMFTDDGQAIAISDPAYHVVGRYMAEMGIVPEVVITWMNSAPPSEMSVPDVADLCEPRVSTFVEGICGDDCPSNNIVLSRNRYEGSVCIPSSYLRD